MNLLNSNTISKIEELPPSIRGVFSLRKIPLGEGLSCNREIEYA